MTTATAPVKQSEVARVGLTKVEFFEKKITLLEGICVVLRAPLESYVYDYDFTEPMPDSASVIEWLHHRVYPRVKSCELEVITGRGLICTQSAMSLGELRASYRR